MFTPIAENRRPAIGVQERQSLREPLTLPDRDHAVLLFLNPVGDLDRVPGRDMPVRTVAEDAIEHAADRQNGGMAAVQRYEWATSEAIGRGIPAPALLSAYFQGPLQDFRRK